MEFSPSQIARLVLGYLKSEKCHTAFDELLKASPHLKENSRGKYVITRVGGLNLVDYLTEYAVISTLIQERLEVTDYFSRDHSRNDLVEQLLYLLDNGFHSDSRASTPIRRCKSPNKRVSDIGVNTEMEFSFERQIDLNATPMESLPGNSCSNSTPICKKPVPLKYLNKSCVDSNKSVLETSHVAVDVLTQTLLENHELHEKIAENINTVRNVSDPSSSTGRSDNKTDKCYDELEAVIKTIVQKTAEDPIFDQLIGEIIGSIDDTNDTELQDEDGSKSFEKSASNMHRTPVSTNIPRSEDNIKMRLRNTKSSAEKKPATIDVHNHEAVQSIIAVSNSVEKRCPVQEQESGPPNDIVVYGGSLEQFLKINKSASSTLVNDVQKSVTSNEAVMMQSTDSVHDVNTIVSTGLVDDSYYMLNSQNHINLGTILTEQDILAMPTVIVCDGNQSAQSHIKPVSTCISQPAPVPRYPKILPDTSKFDSITLYKFDSPQEVCTLVKPIPKKSNSKVAKKKKKGISTNVLKGEGIKYATEKQLNSLQNPPSAESSTSTAVTTEKCEPLTIPSEITPPSKIQESVGKKLPTPRSGSHVRALNFSSPSTLFPATSKMDLASKSASGLAQKQVSKTLFTAETESVLKPENMPEEVKEIKKCIKRPSGSWDSDLRSLIAAEEEEEKPTLKKSSKKKRKKGIDEIAEKLSLTEQSALLIEKALAAMSPEKQNEDEEQSRIDENTETSVKIEENLEKEKTDASVINSRSRSASKKSSTKKKTLEQKKTSHKGAKAADLSEDGVMKDSVDTANPEVKSSAKPRNKKKCNTDHSIMEVTCLQIKEIKAVEVTDDNCNKLVLSPSKLNASKRSLVEVADVPSTSKLLTPEMERETVSNPAVAAKRNITPILETPIKQEVLPRVSGYFSPIRTSDTPFTRVLKEQLSGVDIGSIPTPRFPVTPNLPITPGGDGSGYPNRPTDYSSSSSYYQPSEAENRSLEQLMIEECHRLESKPDTPGKFEMDKLIIFNKSATPAKCHKSKLQQEIPLEKPVTPGKFISTKSDSETEENNQMMTKQVGTSKIQVLEEVRFPPENINEVKNQIKVISDKLKLLSHNTVARKNLSLLKQTNKTVEDEDYFDDSSLSSESSSSDSDSESLCSNDNDKTVKEVNVRYPLRSKIGKSPASNASDVKTINTIISQVEIKHTLDPEKTVNQKLEKEKVLAAMEEKRKRTIAEMKENSNKVTRSAKKKKNCSKASKAAKSPAIMPIRNPCRKFISKNAIKEGSQKKSNTKTISPSENKNKEPNKKYCDENEELVKNVEKNETYQKGDEGEHLEPLEMVETELLENSVSSTPIHELQQTSSPVVTFDKILESVISNENVPKIEQKPELKSHQIEVNSDQEAENLVKGLKQWGIHLVPKKSSERKTEEPKAGKSKDVNEPKDILKIKVKDNPNTILEMSLEEGEIVSDTESCKNENIKEKLPKIAKSSNNRTYRHDSKSAKHGVRDRQRDIRKDRTDGKGKPKSQNTRIEKSKTSVIKNLSTTNVEKNEEKDVNIRQSQNNRESECEKELNTSVQITFDCKLFDKETCVFVYDPRCKSKKTIKDYNFTLLNKEISANVYIDDLDVEVEKFMKVSPFELLLDLPSTPKTIKSKTGEKNKNSASSVEDQPRKTPVGMLYDSLVNSSKPTGNVEFSCNSPLDDLYETTKDSYSKNVCHKWKKERRKSLSCEKSDKVSSRKKIRSRSCSYKSVVSKNEPEINCDEKHVERSKSSSSSLRRKSNEKLRVEPRNVHRNERRKSECPELCSTPVTTNATEENDDELMNYALVGSERIENEDVLLQDKSGKKRKPDEPCGNSQPEKKIKTAECQKLLKKIDVDCFLMKLHGE